jgi:hypothetical protein
MLLSVPLEVFRKMQQIDVAGSKGLLQALVRAPAAAAAETERLKKFHILDEP